MGRAPCCDKANVKKGPWSPEEDAKLKEYIDKYGTGGNWIALPQKAGLRRCGKSCRLRWLNYLRPNIKHGEFSDDEDRIICSLFANIGSRWSIIAAQLPGRTDNDIKNYWNTKLKKKLMGSMAHNSSSHKRPHHQSQTYPPPISLLQYPLPSSSYKCSSNNYYTTLSRSFTGYESMSIPSSLLNTSCCSSTTLLQSQDGYVGPMHNYHQVIFGADQASCSSSDGSCNNNQNQISSHGKDQVEYDHYGVFYNGVDQNQKVIDGFFDQKPNGFFYGETQLDYNSLEEIKQLISTNVCNNLNFFVEENKGEEKVVYY